MNCYVASWFYVRASVAGLFVKFSGSFRSLFNDKPEGDRVLRGQTPTPAG